MLLLSSANFFQNLLFQKRFFQEHYQGVKRFGSRSGRSVLIWVQTVCKVYQQTTEVAASKERVKFSSAFLMGESFQEILNSGF